MLLRESTIRNLAWVLIILGKNKSENKFEKYLKKYEYILFSKKLKQAQKTK